MSKPSSLLCTAFQLKTVMGCKHYPPNYAPKKTLYTHWFLHSEWWWTDASLCPWELERERERERTRYMSFTDSSENVKKYKVGEQFFVEQSKNFTVNKNVWNKSFSIVHYYFAKRQFSNWPMLNKFSYLDPWILKVWLVSKQ